MSDEKKEFTPQETAVAVLKKALELYKNSDLYKSNSAHEVDPGEEPNNDDAECPESLADQGTKFEAKHEQKKKKVEGDSSDPAHEQGMGQEEEKSHDAAENEADEADSDNIEADEEKDEKKKVIEAAAKDKEKKDFEKSEKPHEEKPELHNDKGNYHEEAQKSEEDVAKFCKYCGSEKKMDKCGEVAPAEKNMTQGYGGEMMKKKPSKLKGFLNKKNAKMEKMIGMKPVMKEKE